MVKVPFTPYPKIPVGLPFTLHLIQKHLLYLLQLFTLFLKTSFSGFCFVCLFVLISFLPSAYFFSQNPTQGPSESTVLSHSYVSLHFLYWPLPNEPWEQEFSWLTPFALGQTATVCAAISSRLESTETCLPVLVGKLTENTLPQNNSMDKYHQQEQ